MTLTVQEFRALLPKMDSLQIVDRCYFENDVARINKDEIEYIRNFIASRFGVDESDLIIHVTGSAKLGFSVVEKKVRRGFRLKRYRPFSQNSDVDIAVISNKIFQIMWNELSTFYYRHPFYPRDIGNLGAYLIGGWLRPDHFPKNQRLHNCDTWWDTFNALSSEGRFGRRKVRGGSFASLEQLRHYLDRGIRQCVDAEVRP